MNGHNIIDEGIIKDLERLSEEDPDGFSADVLALINRQKAEIERLEGDLIEERTRRKNAVNAYHEAKVEAIKAFASKLVLKRFMTKIPNWRKPVLAISVVKEIDIDNLVKEMTEAWNERRT